MNKESVSVIVENQRAFFNSGATRPVSFRKAQLKKLRSAILAHEEEILAALMTDLSKSDFEAFTTELVLVFEEIKSKLRHCGKWAKPENRNPGIFNFPARALVHHDPHGVCLIMSPWNYPFQLAITPLVGAIAAGNTAIVKPSAYSGATSAIIAKIIEETFESNYVSVVQGGRDVNKDLLDQHFDYIFFTGSVEVGKLVMQSASRFLTPVTLELGGKSPCIIDRSADIRLSARRAVWGKCINSGQTCVAPDYFLVHESVKDDFIAAMQSEIKKSYGDSPHTNVEFPKIITRHHFDRLSALIAGARMANAKARLISGGRCDSDTMKIEPTIIDGVSWDDPVMMEELFGPIIPILIWKDETEMIGKILARPRPLAFYLFSKDTAQQKRIIERVPFGGGCINDTIMHVGTNTVPFGGTGASGMGCYHGKESFIAFTRLKPVIDKALWMDVALRYAPFAGKYKAFRKFL